MAVSEEAGSRFREGIRLAEAGELDRAIAVFESMTADYPRLPEPYNNLAALYARQGQLDQAKEVLERAIRTDESYATVYENLSTVYVEMARDSYVKALRLKEPGNAPNLQLLARLSPHRETAPPRRLAAAEPEQAEPGQAEPKQAEPKQAEPEQAEPEQAEPKQAEPKQAEPKQAEPKQTRVAKAEAGEAGPPQAALAMLRKWARAWADQDVAGYLGFYGPGFEPPSGRSREQWEAHRHDRIRAPEWIEVQLEDFDFTRLGPDRLRVDLVQRYEASNYQDKTVKRFVLVRRDGDWRIHSEQSLKIIR